MADSDDILESQDEAAEEPRAAKKSARRGPSGAGRSRAIRIVQALLALNVVLLGLVAAVVMDLIPHPKLFGGQDEQASQEEVDLLASPTERGLPEADGHAPPNQAMELSLDGSSQANPPRTTQPQPQQDAPQDPQTIEEIAGDDPLAQPLPRLPRDAWKQAELAFADGHYARSARLFRGLSTRAQAITSERLIGEYFKLRLAQSLMKVGRAEEARPLLDYLEVCHSPILRAMTSLLRARESLLAKRYLPARTQAYRAIAALEAMERKLPLESDCMFLIARSLTELYRTYRTTEQPIVWPELSEPNPFYDLTRKQLRDLLNDGRQQVRPRTLGAKLSILPDPMNPSRWSVTCQDATVQEVLTQFAAQAGLDVQWHTPNPAALRRPMDFAFRSVSSQMFSETVAGMSGLMGRFTLDSILVYDPQAENSAQALAKLVRKEAVSSWRLFFLRFAQDGRVPTGHFALATLLAWSGENVAAVNEYSLLASRFDRSDEAPRALLCSARLKVNMMNYVGARQDLQDLLDLYPTYGQAAEVWLLLGNVNENAGKLDEALDTYRNLYHRNLSSKATKAAALACGRCYYRQKQYEQATKWFARFVATRPQPSSPDYVEAYFLLARSAAQDDKLDIAVQAFQRGLVGNPDRRIRIPALMDLTGLLIRQEQFVKALGIIEKLNAEDLWPAAACRRTELHAEILRSIGLADKARGVIRKAMGELVLPEQQQALRLELARCHWAAKDYPEARKVLAELLPSLQAGVLADKASLLLAEVCMAQNEPQQVITLLRPLCGKETPEDLRSKAKSLLGEAYLSLKQYDKAALALSGESREPQDRKDTTE